MEQGEIHQYIRHASKNVPGFLYERNFDFSLKDFPKVTELSILGYKEVAIEIQSKNATGSLLDLIVKQGNSNDSTNHTAVVTLADLGPNDFKADHDNVCKASWLSFEFSGDLPSEGTVTVRICGKV